MIQCNNYSVKNKVKLELLDFLEEKEMSEIIRISGSRGGFCGRTSRSRPSTHRSVSTEMRLVLGA